MGLGYSELRVGGRYMTCGGNLIRTITKIDGDDIHYADQFGNGQCLKTTFVKRCTRLATESEINALHQSNYLNSAKPNPETTEEVLQILNCAKTQLLHWFVTLERTSAFRAATLTPKQRQGLKEAIDEFAIFANRLRRLEDDLTS